MSFEEFAIGFLNWLWARDWPLIIIAFAVLGLAWDIGPVSYNLIRIANTLEKITHGEVKNVGGRTVGEVNYVRVGLENLCSIATTLEKIASAKPRQ